VKIACVIPARLKSTRFPRKILAPLKGKPLIEWVWEAANATGLFDTVVFAIDAEETADVIASFGGKYVMTPEACLSGTERLVYLNNKKEITADIWVNWQGDEPFISKKMIQDLLQTCASQDSDIWTLKERIENPEDAESTHVVKVICNKDNYALYFSRSLIPYYREPCSHKKYFRHVGLYAYTSEALSRMITLAPCYLEEAEQLEQLSFLYNNMRIKVHETQEKTLGIDLPEHLALAHSWA